VSADEDDQPPPKKKVKATSTKKAKPKSAPLSKARITSPAEDLESSDDDLPLRPATTDADIKIAIREFLRRKDLATVTKGMVKEALRGKYGDDIVKSKREIIAEGIMEGMNS
jgi:DEK C terminal domain